jgi:hypothetical protein
MLSSLSNHVYKHHNAKFSEPRPNFENPRGLLLRLGSGFSASSIALCFRYHKARRNWYPNLWGSATENIFFSIAPTNSQALLNVVCLAAKDVAAKRNKSRPRKSGINIFHQSPISNNLHYTFIIAKDKKRIINVMYYVTCQIQLYPKLNEFSGSIWSSQHRLNWKIFSQGDYQR